MDQEIPEDEAGGEGDLAKGGAEGGLAAAAGSGVCLACGNQTIGPFCAWCGQKNDDLRRSSLILASEFMRDTFGFDSRMWRTLGLLAVAPGVVPSNYSNGKRSRYTPPVRLFLVVSFLFFLMLGLTKTLLIAVDVSFDPVDHPGVVIGDEATKEDVEREVAAALAEAGRVMPKEVQEGIDEDSESSLSVKASRENCPTAGSLKFFVRQSELTSIERDLGECIRMEAGESASADDLRVRDGFERISRGVEAALENPVAFNNSFNNWLPRVMFLMTPVLALILALFIRGPNALIFDHLVLSLYSHAAGFAIVIAAILASRAGMPQVGLAASLAMMAYFVLALKNAYARGWVKTLWTAFMASFLYLIILFSAVMWIVWRIIWQGG